MGVLHVVHRVVVVLGDRQVHVKGVFGIGLARQQEKPHGVFAGPLHQVAQGHIAACALGNFDFGATTHHAHHGVQHVVGVARRNAQMLEFGRGLQPGAHSCNRAVVVGALDVDDLGKATLPFGQVVGHVRHKVGVAAVALFHDTVFVVAIVGGPQPQRTVFFKGFACTDERVHRRLDPAAAVQAAFQVVVVKLQGEGLQIQILLAAQVGHRELAHAFKVAYITAGGKTAVVRGHGFAG